jgi:hypothetical protein
MPVRPERPALSAAQRALAILDAAYTRSAAALERAIAHRAEVVAEQDRRVAAAQAAVDRAVGEMANNICVELTARLLDPSVNDGRRLAKRNAPRAPRGVAERGGNGA